VIGKLGIGAEQADRLRSEMRREGSAAVDYSLFCGSPDDSMGLMVDLVALAKRDGEFHISERMYIRDIAKTIGYSPDDADALMAAD
jgi:tellurite resistance protein